jgi:hypothetical protein
MGPHERRTVPGVEPLPAVRSKFWNSHPRLVQVVALAALGWGGAP